MGIEWSTVRALVVARWRELVQDRVRLLSVAFMSLGVGWAIAGPRDPSTWSFGFLEVEFGVIAVLWAVTDLSRGWMDIAPRTGLSVPRPYCIPALPMSVRSRVAAAGAIAALLSFPFVVLTTVVGTLHGQAYEMAAARVVWIAIGICIGLTWYRFDRGRFGHLLSRANGLLTVRPPKGLSEVGAVFWTGLPTSILWMLLMTPLGVGLALLFLWQVGPVSGMTHPRLMRIVMSFPSYAVWASVMSSMFVPLRSLAVSRRAIAVSEFYLSLLMLLFCVVFTLALTQAVSGDFRFTRATAHLIVMLSAVGVLSRVAYVRIASSTDVTGAGFGVLLGSMMFGWFGFALLSFYVSRHVLDVISAAALVGAVTLAYTAPRSALSQPAHGVPSRGATR